MATGTFLDNLSDWNAKSAVVIKDLALAGEFETASLLMSLRSVANDETLSNEVRLNALTALINRAELLDVALPPYYPLSFTYPSAEKYVGLHNDLSGLNTGNYWHLTYQEYLDVLNKPSFSDFTFANLTGDPYDNGNLEADLNSKEDLIASGSNGQFFAWDKTMRFVDWANLSNKPTTLAGLGISVGDTLFNSKYLQTSSVLTSYVVGANQIVNNTDTLIGAIGKLQGQINSITTGGGSISTVGLAMPNIFTVGNSPLTGAGGTINVTLQNQLAKRFFASPTSSTGTPTFREIVAADLPTSGISAGTYGNTTNWPLITVDAYGRVTNVTLQAATSGGTVTSVSLSAPAGFSVSGSPVTTTGTLGFSWTNQTAAYVLAGPISGAAAAPSFRALVATDIPTIEISQVNTLQATLDALSDGSLGVLATDAVYIGNGSDAAVASVVSGDLAGAYLNDAGTNRAVFTIENQAVTFSKFQNITSGKLLGRYTATTGSMQEISLDPLAFTLNASTGVLGLATPNPALLTAPGDLLTSDGTTQVKLSVGANATFLIADSAQTKGIKWAALSGDAAIAVSGALTIAAGAVTLGKMANANAFSIIGNDTASTSNAPKYLTKTEATTLINTFDATADLPGLVPNGSGNDATKFLSGAGTWLTVSGGAGTTTNAVTFNNTGGAAPGTTFNGSVARTIDYSTVGAPSVSGSGATGTWPIAISGNAATVTNGVYTSSTYNDPSWIGSLAGSKITGNISGSAGSVANSLFIGSGLSGSTFNGSANVTISLNMASANTFTALQTFEGQIAVGKLTAAGNIKLFGSSSGFVSLQAPASPDSTTYTLPSTVGSAGQYLKLSTTGGTLVWDTPGGLSGTATQYAVLVGGAGNTIASLGAGTTTGQLLQYNSGSNNPSWTSVVYPASTTQNRILYSSSNNTIGEITAPSDGTFLRYTTAGGYSWSAAVTSFSVGTQGLISNSGTATAPVLAVTGNQGGIVYFTGANTWASSPTLDQYELVMGGGTGAPTTINTGANNTLLISNGINNAPSWTIATYPSSITNKGILYGSGTDAVGQIVAPSVANTFLKWDGSTFTWAAAGGGGGSGTVTSVGILVPAFLSVTNSPITGAGDITIGLSGTALPITSGGTGGVTAIAARANILPIYTANYILGVNSGGTDVEWVNITGTGNVVRATSPTLTTPNIGAAVATSVNGLTITTTTGTLTLVNGSTLATSGAFSTTLTATALTNVTLPTTGTLATLAGTELLTNKTLNSPLIGNAVGQGHLHLHTINNNPPSSPSADYITIFADDSPKRFGFQFGLDGFESYFEFAAASTSKTYTFPNATGTVALIDSTQTLTIPASVGASGSIALGVSGGGTVSLLAPATVTGAGVYTLPNAYPTGANQYLTATTGGVMSWVTIAAGGDVVGPSSATDGDFVVFDGTTGKLIKEPLNASLTAAGRATFNSGVDVGVSGTTTGSLVFRNQTTAATTTLQASTSQITNLIYTLPITAPGAGNVLSSDINGNLSWTAAGSGDMTLAGTQTVTGAKTFGSVGNVGKLILAGATSGTTVLNSGAAAGSSVLTLPVATSTLACLGLAQTFTAAQTFQANVTLGTGSYNSTLLDFTGTTSNRINFNQTIASGPATNLTPSVGTRIVIANTGSASGSANSIGFNTGEMWLNHDLSGAISFYNNTTRFMRFTGGYLEMLGSAGSFRMEGTTSNMIRFNANGSSAPGYSSSGDFAGTKIIFLPQLGSGINSYAMGVNATDLWTAGAASYTWYGSSNIFLKQVITNGVSFGAVAATAGFMTLASGIPTILFNSQVSNAPSTSSRSTGTRIVINPTFSAGVSTDSAIGVSGSGSGGAGNWQMWFSTPGTMNFYAGNATATPSIAMSTNGIVCNNGFSATTSQITFGGGLVNGWALIGATATASWAAPSTTTRVDGTRIVLFPVASAINNWYDAGIGIQGTTAGGFQNVNTYISSPGDVRFYSGAVAGAVFSVSSTAVAVADGVNYTFNTTNGTKIGTATGQKIAFWNKTPIVQPTTAIAGAAFNQVNTTTAVSQASTFGGYTLQQIAAALINTGILA
jgi:hypothetical protein